MRRIVHFLFVLLALGLSQASYAEMTKEEKAKTLEQYLKEFPSIDPLVIQYAVEHEMKPDVLDKILKEVEKQDFAIFEDYDIKIAYDTHEECDVSSYSNFYHCVCTSVNYVEILRQNGGQGMYGAHLGEAKRNCPFVESVANMSYVECMRGMGMVPVEGFDKELYCECYANRYARQFQINPKTGRSDRYYMRKDAYAFCRSNYKSQAVQSVIETEQ